MNAFNNLDNNNGDKNEQFLTPVLFLIFNRLETTQEVFARIKRIKPAQLFIAADGPRVNKEGEKDKCEEVRQWVLAQIDWNCEVKTLFRNTNLGCGLAISQAITWFFENVEEGIILEDDCLPDISFFQFCAELLERYRTDKKIMSVSGSYLLKKSLHLKEQSYFFGHGSIWGWATWKRAWDLYDIRMTGWEQPSVQRQVKKALKTKGLYRYYYPMFESVYKGTLDAWGVQWFYSILMNHGLGIQPVVNLVANIGFGSEGTNTIEEDHAFANASLHSIAFPLRHPVRRTVNIEYLRQLSNVIYPQKKTGIRTLFEKIFSLIQKS